jgi:hypothetical protein
MLKFTLFYLFGRMVLEAKCSRTELARSHGE